MKVLILTSGTRGDVQPFVALAGSLSAAGHEVMMCAPISSKDLIEEYGVRSEYFEDNAKKRVMNRELGRLLEGKQRISLLYLARHHRNPDPNQDPRLIQYRKMAEIGRLGADVIVHSSYTPGNQVAELLGVPSIPVYLQPFPLSFASPHLPAFIGTKILKIRKLYILAVARILLRHRNPLVKWRHETLQLPKRRRSKNPLRAPDGSRNTAIQAFSQYVVPRSVKRKRAVHTTGYWFLPATQNWEPSRELREFIANGTRPIYVGFGSLVGGDPSHTTRIVMKAIRMARTRAVVAICAGGIDRNELGDGTFAVDYAPHDWLFPQMAAIVHAGGAGTTAASLLAGRPQVVCPFSMDQPFWAHRMHRMGVAPSPQPQRDIDPDRLSFAMQRAVTDRAMTERAQQLSQQVRSEDGVAAAVKIIESVVQK